jgi:pyruvate/2-oxoacid:ferredoxin oxidoreductase beta subunit
MFHTAFETGGSVSSGVAAAVEMKGWGAKPTILVWAGDGGTSDIGVQALSGACERNENIIYTCYDNEAYMNTGIQRSSSTPYGAWTTTTPVKSFKSVPKKNMLEIIAAHRVPYVASASIAYPEDLIRKYRKAKSIEGLKYLHVLAPCPTGWRYEPRYTIKLARLAVRCGIFPLYEVERGRYRITKKVKDVAVEEYLRMQGRFAHLDEKERAKIQQMVDAEWANLLRKEEFSAGARASSREK